MIQITAGMINSMGTGAWCLDNVRRIREILTEAGVQDIQLHELEIAEIRKQRDHERLARGLAEKLLAAGPMPPCACVLHGDGTVESTFGCSLGHRVGQFPDEVK